MDNREKPIIMVLTGHYLPGVKAGGILHNLVNTVNALSDEFIFKIITRDRDLGDLKPYNDISPNEWLSRGNTLIYYLSPEMCTVNSLSDLIMRTSHDVLYLTSCFDRLTVFTLLGRKLGRIGTRSIIIEPNGEFGRSAIKQKHLKKIIYIGLSRLLRLYNGIYWRAANESEKQDVIRYMKVKSDFVQKARHLSEKAVRGKTSINKFGISGLANHAPSNENELKIIFLSRIVPGKNLYYALEILKHVRASVVLDIYGPVEDVRYWKKCMALITRLPRNIRVNYLGTIEHDSVEKTFELYDMFLFPSRGESYGMVIAESLMAGTPVLTSDMTAWKNLEEEQLGWDIPLRNREAFVSIIDTYASCAVDKRLMQRELIKSKIYDLLVDPAILDENRALFYRRVENDQ